MTVSTHLRTFTRFGVLFFHRGALRPVPVALGTPLVEFIK